ncbi:UDP-N-acetylmuramoyl-L-alanine--D-glutamate ligase [Flavobacteriaceae bacterium UJ101]|nr:UDP-N-acetylmuramoyl-L-alanine--D-glutamate ligase [Flavobacteriaceae bacterium UJ101]
MQKIVVLGGGESGVGAAILAQKEGFEVFLSDRGEIQEKYKNTLLDRGIDFEEKKHSLEKIFEADEVIKSPGIPDSVKMIQELKSKEIPVISEIEFAGRYTSAKIIAITGSNGKTTTTSLLYYILKQDGFNVGLGGNIGKSFAWQVAENEFDFYVLELSSFQLDGIVSFRPDIAILLNITPDHLDRYEYKMENYVDSKFRITMNQTEEDLFIYSKDDQEIEKRIENKEIKSQKRPFSLDEKVDKGAFVTEKEIIINTIDDIITMKIDDLALQGKHNVANSMAAGIAAKLLKVRKESLKNSLSNFEAVEHRLEKVLTIHGINFINDSKATNVNATYYALDSMESPTVWIVGGTDKGNDYTEIIDLVKSKVKAIVCLGVDNTKLLETFEGVTSHILETNCMRDAVQFAYALGEKGDTVLLSPACASFDLFQSYEDRGSQFKEQVRKL